MNIAVFDKRIQPARIAGIPEISFFTIPTALGLLVVAFMLPNPFLKLVVFSASAGCAYIGWYTWKTYDDYLIYSALENGKRSRKRVSLFAQGKRTYMEYFHWRSFCSESAIEHDDGSISVAFTWKGVHERFFDDNQFASEHRRRVALLKTFPTDIGLVVENHLIRSNDTDLIDAYVEVGQKMSKRRDVPEIALDVRERLAELYRPMARSNRVLTIFSVGKPRKQGLLDYFMPSSFMRIKNATELMKTLTDALSSVESSYPGYKLLSHGEYARNILDIYRPYYDVHEIDWRFPLSPQLITEKPQIDDDGCLKINDTFYKCCLIQNYPSMGYGWTFRFCEASIDLHAVQILSPISTDKAIERNQKQGDFELQGVSKKRGTEKAVNKISNATDYRKYVIRHGLSVANNAYILTFANTDKSRVLYYAAKFKKDVLENGGLVRDNLDLQLELFRLRLPGQGRYSSFFREDHADTLAGMAPFTTYDCGVDKPESLRISFTGQLIGSSPSKLEVPHELVVAETNAGKDTFYGMKFIETFPEIRYDIAELGNSYQGVIEAVGGHYCRAREQVINPLSTFDDYRNAKALTESGAGRIDVDFVRTQSDLLTPIFKGMKGGNYTKPEEVIVNKLIRHIYDKSTSDADAPTLPDLLEAINKIETESDKQERARDEFGEELFEFLSTETGSCFKERDQFVISPIANGIDFDKFDGELFDYYMMFITIRLATAAMSRGTRSQIVLNEFKVLLERAPEPIRRITLTIDRMGRKDWVGLTRITQGLSEIKSIDPEALNSIPNKTLLSRQDDLHNEIGQMLKAPAAVVEHWKRFEDPSVMNKLGYREGIVCAGGEWNKLHLRFPHLLLDLMNTRGDDKTLRDKAYLMSRDPYERIDIFNALKKERDNAIL